MNYWHQSRKQRRNGLVSVRSDCCRFLPQLLAHITKRNKHSEDFNSGISTLADTSVEQLVAVGHYKNNLGGGGVISETAVCRLLSI
jgi:hypothetical protein